LPEVIECLCQDDLASASHGTAHAGGSMSWIVLCVAGLFEVVWAIGLKHLSATSALPQWIGTIVAIFLSTGLLAVAMKQLPFGTSYAIWTGIGTIGTFVVGVVWFGDNLSTMRVISAALLLLGLIGLKVSN